MTLEQRERLNRLIGKLDGLAWGIESQAIADGLMDVVESLEVLLKEDGKDG